MLFSDLYRQILSSSSSDTQEYNRAVHLQPFSLSGTYFAGVVSAECIPDAKFDVELGHTMGVWGRANYQVQGLLTLSTT